MVVGVVYVECRVVSNVVVCVSIGVGGLIDLFLSLIWCVGAVEQGSGAA